MRLLVVIALVCVVGASAYPPVGGGYYGAGSGMENAYGNQGHMSGGGMNTGVYDNVNSNFRRIEEGSNSRNFGAHNNMGHLNRGGSNFGFGRGGTNMYGGGMGPMGPMGPMG